MVSVDEIIHVYKQCDEVNSFPYVEGGRVFAQRIGLEITGFLYVKDNSFNEIDIIYIGVLETFRRQGVGRKLVVSAQQQYDKIFLEVAYSNEAALYFYQSMGFSTLRRRSNYYGVGQDALEMMWSKELS